MHEDGTEHAHDGPIKHNHEGLGAVIELDDVKKTG